MKFDTLRCQQQVIPRAYDQTWAFDQAYKIRHEFL